MGQVIEVRLVDGKTNEVFADEFTLTSVKYNPNDHTPMHREAIGLALSAWGGEGARNALKSIERNSEQDGVPAYYSAEGVEHLVTVKRADGTTVRIGPPAAHLYGYRCVIEDKKGEHPFHAYLFATYKEKSAQSERAPDEL